MPCNSDSPTTGDYLDMLPVEIWTEIIVDAAEPFEYMSLPDSIKLHPAKPVDYSQAKTSQRLLSAILQTCKALYAIAEPMLYQFACLTSQAAYDIFLESALRKATISHAHHHYRGEWTKEIYIIHEEQTIGLAPCDELQISPASLFSACPNATHLTLGSGDGVIQVNWLDKWSEKLISLSLASELLQWDDLYEFSLRFPHLTMLKIEFCSRTADCRGWIKFPSLTHLSITHNIFEYFDPLMLNCPRLRSLHVEVFGGGNLVALLKDHADTITELRMLRTENTDFPVIPFPSNLFTACKKLRWLSFIVEEIMPVQDPTRVVEHKELSHLHLLVSSMTDTSNLESHAEIFSSHLFPNIYLVTFEVPEDASESSRALIVSKLNVLFPKAEIQLR